MATPIPYFIYPFAEAGDTSAITLTGIDTDPINYQAGYGTRYELDLNTDSSALPINRYTMNQLFLDITSAIQQQGSSTLVFNAGSADSNLITINNPTNVNLAYFDQDNGNTLTIGSETKRHSLPLLQEQPILLILITYHHYTPPKQ